MCSGGACPRQGYMQELGLTPISWRRKMKSVQPERGLRIFAPPEGVLMSFQICIKTDKSLQQLATEIRNLFSLPPFRQNTFSGEPYCQFEMLGMLILIHLADEEDRDPEVMKYQYRFDLQTSFTDHELDTDDMEYNLQPYLAQLLSFRLHVGSANLERK